MDLLTLSNFAIKAAQNAGKIIQKQVGEELHVEKKEAGKSLASQVVTAVDRACEKVIMSHLVPSCEEFDLGWLSEETEDDGSRFEKDFFWCVDPLDGTLPFIEKRAGFSVSIALVARDGSPHIGVVFDPSTKHLYHAVKGHGVYKDGKPWESSAKNGHLTYVTDRKLKDTPRADEIKQFLQTKAIDLSLRSVKEIAGAGSVLNAIRVLENGPACMLKFPKKEAGGGSIWDFAATACLFQELGLPATNFSDGKLDLNRKDSTFMNHKGILYSNF